MMLFLMAVAPAAAQPTNPLQKLFSGGLGQFTPFILIFGVFYFLMIAPQQKKQKELDAWKNRLAVGDEVVTTGGLVGKITSAAEDTVVVEVGDKVRVKVLRSHVTGPAPGAKAEKVAADAKSDVKTDTKSDSKKASA
jgi:preprotein translocase subunit YajC